MSGLILPGGGSVPAKKDDTDYDSLSEEQKAAVAALAEKENPEDLLEEVETLFVVIKQKDGSFGIANTLDLPVRPARTADENDYHAAFAIVSANLQAAQTAAMVQQGMMQQAAMMQRAAQEQAIASRLKLK